MWCFVEHCLSSCPLSIDRCIVLFLLTTLLSSFYWPLYCPLSIDCCIVLFLLTAVLSSFYWPLYCPLSIDRFIVLFLLTAVLFSFYWPMYCPLSTDRFIVLFLLVALLSSFYWLLYCRTFFRNMVFEFSLWYPHTVSHNNRKLLTTIVWISDNGIDNWTPLKIQCTDIRCG